MRGERLRASWYKKSQNLRDQASRLEKIDTNDSASNVQVNGLDTDAEESTISNISNNILSETIGENSYPKSKPNQNANETIETQICILLSVLNRNRYLDIRVRGFWERQRSAFFDVRVCHPNADSYCEQKPEQIYKQHENEKKRQYGSRVMEVEQGTFTPLIFSITGGMGAECKLYHKRLVELSAIKKGESYATTMQWVRAKVSSALIGSALLCLRGSPSIGRTIETSDTDFSEQNAIARIT